jgi:hypothetical protein
MNRIFLSLVMVFSCLCLDAQNELPVIPEDQIPPAVQLDDVSGDSPLVVRVNATEATVNTKKTSRVDLSKRVRAKNVYTGTLSANKTSMYFIQLAAIFNSNGNASEFKSLGVFGNIYKQFSGDAVKIKLGYFQDRNEASDILRQIKSMGYRDAFITQNKINSPDMELAFTGSHYIQGSVVDNTPGTTISSSKASYKIRLESYDNSVLFSSESVDDLGKIEQWTKGKWTIFVLSAFNSLEEAIRVKNIAVDRGFSNADVVLDNNGMLEKVSY